MATWVFNVYIDRFVR